MRKQNLTSLHATRPPVDNQLQGEEGHATPDVAGNPSDHLLGQTECLLTSSTRGWRPMYTANATPKAAPDRSPTVARHNAAKTARFSKGEVEPLFCVCMCACVSVCLHMGVSAGACVHMCV